MTHIVRTIKEKQFGQQFSFWRIHPVSGCGGVNQRAKVSRLSGKTASKKDHPDVLNPPVLTGVTWRVLLR